MSNKFRGKLSNDRLIAVKFELVKRVAEDTVVKKKREMENRVISLDNHIAQVKNGTHPNLLACLSNDQESKLPTKVRGRRTSSQKKLMRLQKELSSRFEKERKVFQSSFLKLLDDMPVLMFYSLQDFLSLYCFHKDKVSVIMKKTKTIKSIEEDDLQIILQVMIEGLLYELVATTNSTIENWIFVFCYKL
ncbi:hypothetical protein CDAR_24012 [Caerostris darwini]|uniref:Uncharacterized protein n=1 Tax=Caerostris darwini TaxID=1538125 RepID=A0AAV4QHT7_9ARAC|nr:hypothetical protein CDAR_24012 [Caerostris darwini]